MSSQPKLKVALDPLFGNGQGGLTVSRMGIEFISKPLTAPGRFDRGKDEPKRKKPVRRPTTRETVPIESTLRARKDLTTSYSEPTLLPRRFYVPKGQGVPQIPVPATASVIVRGGKTETGEALAVPVPFWHHHVPKPLTPNPAVPRTASAGPMVPQATREMVRSAQSSGGITGWPVGNSWHSLLTGQQQIDIPAMSEIPVEETDYFVKWYRRRELLQSHEKQPSGDEFALVDHFPPPPALADGLAHDANSTTLGVTQPPKATQKMSFTPAMAAKGWQRTLRPIANQKGGAHDKIVKITG